VQVWGGEREVFDRPCFKNRNLIIRIDRGKEQQVEAEIRNAGIQTHDILFLSMPCPHRHAITDDRRYDFWNIFAEKFIKNIGVFLLVFEKIDHNIGL
jgi:hypothetical protein